MDPVVDQPEGGQGEPQKKEVRGVKPGTKRGAYRPKPASTDGKDMDTIFKRQQALEDRIVKLESGKEPAQAALEKHIDEKTGVAAAENAAIEKSEEDEDWL